MCIYIYYFFFSLHLEGYLSQLHERHERIKNMSCSQVSSITGHEPHLSALWLWFQASKLSMELFNLSSRRSSLFSCTSEPPRFFFVWVTCEVHGVHGTAPGRTLNYDLHIKSLKFGRMTFLRGDLIWRAMNHQPSGKPQQKKKNIFSWNHQKLRGTMRNCSKQETVLVSEVPIVHLLVSLHY